jgi:alkanesulfonate monooxygenase SsuD/methylene tetrahydromethanopterin reductase-like flavin-dependent oxidoreductase (luciferase family)
MAHERTRPVRIGIQLPEVERVVRWPEYAAMARAAEEVGFDSIWVGDHLLYRGDGRPERGPWEAFTLLSSLAAVTERVQLGPLVACAGFHPPGLIAKMASTVDEISGGRFVLGLGAGWNRTEFDAFGLPFDRRVDRFAEAWAIIRELVAGHRSTVEGTHWSTRDAVLLPSRDGGGSIPLMIGSNGARVLELTLPTASMWNTWFTDFGNSPDGFASLTARVSSIAERVGRDPRTVERSACVLVRPDDADGAGERPDDPAAPAITGSAAQIATALRAVADAGADELIVVADPITETSIRTLGEAIASV